MLATIGQTTTTGAIRGRVNVIRVLLAVAAVATVGFHADPAVATGGEEAALKSKILLRALAYDRGFKDRAGDSVTVAVVFRREKPDSLAAKQQIAEALSELAKLTFDGLPMIVVEHAYTNAPTLKTFAAAADVDVMYVCPGMADAVADLVGVSRSSQIATITSEVDFVRDGLSVGVAVQGRNPRLFVNQPASKAEGMRLSADLMRIAEVVQ